jgi:hypothetical protein
MTLRCDTALQIGAIMGQLGPYTRKGDVDYSPVRLSAQVCDGASSHGPQVQGLCVVPRAEPSLLATRV